MCACMLQQDLRMCMLRYMLYIYCMYVCMCVYVKLSEYLNRRNICQPLKRPLSLATTKETKKTWGRLARFHNIYTMQYIHTFIHTYVHTLPGGEVHAGDVEVCEGSSQENSLHDIQATVQVSSSGWLTSHTYIQYTYIYVCLLVLLYIYTTYCTYIQSLYFLNTLQT